MSKSNPYQKDYTPTPVVHQGLDAIRKLAQLEGAKHVMDLSAGSGSFGAIIREVFPGAESTGVEPRPEERWWLSRNYDHYQIRRFSSDSLRYDLIVSNPPFHLWKDLFADGIASLKPRGVLAFLGLTSWGSRSKAGAELFHNSPPIFQLRVTGTVGYHGRGQGTDVRDYCWWVWTVDKGYPWSKYWVSLNLPRMDPNCRTWVVPPGREGGYGAEVQLCPEEHLLSSSADCIPGTVEICGRNQ